MLKPFNELDEARKPDAIEFYNEFKTMSKDVPKIEKISFNFDGVTPTFAAYNKEVAK